MEPYFKWFLTLPPNYMIAYGVEFYTAPLVIGHQAWRWTHRNYLAGIVGVGVGVLVNTGCLWMLTPKAVRKACFVDN
jgi:hypothetical protein